MFSCIPSKYYTPSKPWVYSKCSINTCWMKDQMGQDCVWLWQWAQRPVWILTLILLSCAVQDPSLNFSVSLFLQLWHGNTPSGVLGETEWVNAGQRSITGLSVHREGSVFSLSFFQFHVLQENCDEGTENSSKSRAFELGPEREVGFQLLWQAPDLFTEFIQLQNGDDDT